MTPLTALTTPTSLRRLFMRHSRTTTAAMTTSRSMMMVLSTAGTTAGTTATMATNQLEPPAPAPPPPPPPPPPNPPRRSLFSCPADQDRFLLKAQTLQADTIVLDLEDGVAPDRKHVARQKVVEILQDSASSSTNSSWTFSPTTELAVRINALETGNLAWEDLQAILPLPRLQALVIPKVESANDLDFCARLIHMIRPPQPTRHEEQQRPVALLAAVESAEGLMNLATIAAHNQQHRQHGQHSSRSSSRLEALIFASEDYCSDLELVRTPQATELLYARSALVTAAKSHNLQAIDMVHIEYKNLQGLQDECQMGRQLGMTGKQAIHPIQIDTIHQAYQPTAQDVDFATRVIQEYQATLQKENGGGGACVVDGIVVDAPVYKWAIKILHRAGSR